VLVCDGAMGTMLYARGVFVNRSFDALNLTSPDLVSEVHREYVRAGADVIETNTFGANRIKLGSFGLADKLHDINLAGARIARQVARDGAYVAGAIGPLSVRIEPWADADLPILEQTLGDPAMTEHLGGPESPEQIARRHAGYAEPGSGQFRIVVGRERAPAGWVGYWDREWRGEQVYEIGWSVIPSFQGRGIATTATAQALAAARAAGGHRFVHAFPSVANGASNAICRKAGFTLVGEYDFEYPPGNALRCNDWRFDLQADAR